MGDFHSRGYAVILHLVKNDSVPSFCTQAFESADGWRWRFLSTVLTPSDAVASNSEEGPPQPGPSSRLCTALYNSDREQLREYAGPRTNHGTNGPCGAWPGPNECDITTLADGKTLLAVIRIDPSLRIGPPETRSWAPRNIHSCKSP